MIIDWQSLYDGFLLIVQPEYLLLAFIGVLFGTVLGMIPGLTGSIGMAILLPMTFFMEPLAVLCLLLGIYAGGLYGGSISAILINTPGTPGAVMTALDGYQLTKQGRPLFSLFLGMISSTMGGLTGVIILILSVNTFGRLVLKLGSAELFMIVFLALSIIATISPGSMAKTLFAGFVGIMLGTVGMSATGLVRGTMGSLYLIEGVPFIPALVGVFALSEALILAKSEFLIDIETRQNVFKQSILKEMFAALKEVIKRPILFMKSTILGVFIGALPAAGGSAASVVAYGEAKRSSKTSETFGKGNVEGVIASESANNACEGGSMATTFILGIPGSAAGAVILSAFYLQGWVPGPRLFMDHKEVMYGVLNIMFLEQFMLMLSGFIVITIAYRVIKLPNSIIAPCLVMMSCVGAYAYRGSMFDVGIVVFFGILAFILRDLGYPVIALILGILLGGMVDEQLIRTGQRFAGDFLVFFQRPICLTLVILTALSLARSLYMDYKRGLLSIWEKPENEAENTNS